MKKIILITLSLFVTSCHSQEKEAGKNKPSKDQENPVQLEIPINPKTMETYTNEKFDIENYLKHKSKQDGVYEYQASDGAKILETDIDGYSFFRYITPKYSFFTTHKEYYKNGSLKSSWQTYINDGFTKGVRYEYSEQGKLIKAEDYDKPFKFEWGQVKKYIEQDLKLDLLKDKVGISNNLEYPGYSFPIWVIDYIGQYKDDPKKGIIRIKLSGVTGELLLVERQLGKGGDGTTVDVLYKKKN